MKGHILTSVEYFDPQHASSSTFGRSLTNMSTPRFGAAAVTLNNKIYVMGGFSTKYASSAMTSVEYFTPTPSGGSWTSVANMNTARGLAAASVVNGKIYVMGGTDNNQTIVNSVEMYDPQDGNGSVGVP